MPPTSCRTPRGPAEIVSRKMSTVFLERLQGLNTSDTLAALQGIKRGFEKESLRTNNKMLAQTQHPAQLGASLTHPLITTDYSEALLEFITPPTTKLYQPFQYLTELHQYTYSILAPHEVLWAGSMPCHLPENEAAIPIAQYGDSHLGQLKHVYRKGLGFRYGRMMQMIAGVHYNFSLPMAFWKIYHQYLKSTDDLQSFISAQYLHIIRNFLRLGWLLPLVFGASPTASDYFIHNYFSIDATSLRLSDCGYKNRSNANFPISYNTFSEFIQSIEKAVYTSVPEYEKIGVKVNNEYRQLSSTFFQLEDEHYGLIRPKRVSPNETRMLRVMKEEGIEYLEVRALDVDPFSPIGITPNTTHFIDSFLLMCLFEESKPLTASDQQRINHNLSQVVNHGRNVQLTLDDAGKSRNAREWAIDILHALTKIAALLDKTYQASGFSNACIIAKENLDNFQHLLSNRLCSLFKKNGQSYLDNMWILSLQHRDFFAKNPLDETKKSYYDVLSKESLIAAQKIQNNFLSFDEYLSNYLKKD